MSLEMKWEEGKEGALRCGADSDLKCWCGWCDNSEAWEESTGADLVCLACLSHPFNENGMQCTPPHIHTHAPTPHCTEPHCVPPCTPTAFNFKAANNNKEGEGE